MTRKNRDDDAQRRDDDVRRSGDVKRRRKTTPAPAEWPHGPKASPPRRMQSSIRPPPLPAGGERRAPRPSRHELNRPGGTTPGQFNSKLMRGLGGLFGL